MPYNLSSGACFSLQMHLVLVTKYRRKVITAEVLLRLEEIFHSTCLKWESRVVEFNGEPDHVHLLIDYNPKVQISKFVNNLKTVSSRLIRKEFEQQRQTSLFKACLLVRSLCMSRLVAVLPLSNLRNMSNSNMLLSSIVPVRDSPPTINERSDVLVGVPSRLRDGDDS